MNNTYLIQEMPLVIPSMCLFVCPPLDREILEGPCPANTMGSGTWWASQAGVKAAVRRRGRGSTPTWSSMWTGFWRKLKQYERVQQASLRGPGRLFHRSELHVSDKGTGILYVPL